MVNTQDIICQKKGNMINIINIGSFIYITMGKCRFNTYLSVK